MSGSLLVAAAVWAMLGIVGMTLLDQYFVREFGEGTQKSRWIGALLGPFMLSLAIKLLSDWEREDRFVDEEDAA